MLFSPTQWKSTPSTKLLNSENEKLPLTLPFIHPHFQVSKLGLCLSQIFSISSVVTPLHLLWCPVTAHLCISTVLHPETRESLLIGSSDRVKLLLLTLQQILIICKIAFGILMSFLLFYGQGLCLSVSKG